MSGEVKQAEWTILVYIAGDATLANFGVESLKQLRAAAGKRVVVAAQFYAAGQNFTHRLIFTGSDTDGSMWSAKENIAACDMTDPKTLTEFMLWVRKHPKCKAEHYCLVLWGHGPELLLDEYFVSDGEERISFMTPPQLRRGLDCAKRRGFPKFDIIGIDACSMSMVEVANELSEYADFLVASQDDVPDLSFPYQKLLKLFQRRLTTAKICEELPGQYAAAYQDYIVNRQTNINHVTLASIRLDSVQPLVRSLCRLTKAMLGEVHNPNVRKAILEARRDAKDFVSGLYVDLCDFCESLQDELCCAGVSDGELLEACREVCRFIETSDRRLIVANEAPLDSNAHGLSIYFPYLQDADIDDIGSNEVAVFAMVKGGGVTQGVKGGGVTQGVKGGGVTQGVKGGGVTQGVKDMQVLGPVRRKRIVETEAYFPELQLRRCCWYDFITQVWSRILVDAEPSGLDLRYSAEQCARNLNTLLRPLPHFGYEGDDDLQPLGKANDAAIPRIKAASHNPKLKDPKAVRAGKAAKVENAAKARKAARGGRAGKAAGPVNGLYKAGRAHGNHQPAP